MSTLKEILLKQNQEKKDGVLSEEEIDLRVEEAKVDSGEALNTLKRELTNANKTLFKAFRSDIIDFAAIRRARKTVKNATIEIEEHKVLHKELFEEGIE